MDSRSFKTAFLKKGDVQQEWLLVDVSHLPLGRVSSRIAFYLRGKHLTSFTPHMDCGTRVVVINADKVRLTGNKATSADRAHMWYTGYPGGERFRTPAQYIERGQGARVIENAVRRMLPKSRLGRELYRNLYVYNDANHPHEAQAPKALEITV